MLFRPRQHDVRRELGTQETIISACLVLDDPSQLARASSARDRGVPDGGQALGGDVVHDV